MTDVRCPRCHRDAPEGTAFCAGCGAPLLLRDEAPGPSLDAPLDLDCRSLRPPPARVATPMETVPGVLPAPLPGPAATPPPRPPPVPGAAPAPAGSHANELASIERSHWDLRTITAAARGQPIAAPAIPALAAAPPPPPPPAAARAAAGGASAPVPVPAAAPAEVDDLPDADVEELEVHVARAEPWRRGVAWLVDGVPFVAAGGGLGFVLLREAAAARGAAPRGLEELVDLVARERVIALSVAAAVALALVTYATLAHALGGATLGKRLVRSGWSGRTEGRPRRRGARFARPSPSSRSRCSGSDSSWRCSPARAARSTTSSRGRGW